MVSSNYELLFSPTKIGNLSLKNRVAKVAAQTYFFDSGGWQAGNAI